MDSQNFMDVVIPVLFLVIWVVTSVIQAIKKKKPSNKGIPPLMRRSDESSFDPLEELFGPEVMEELQRQTTQKEGLVRADELLRQAKKAQPKPSSKRPNRDYLAELHAQQVKLEQVEAETQALLATEQEAYYIKPIQTQATVSPETYSKSIADLLSHKDSLQQAILAYEVLGTPLALRNHGQMGRSWDV